MKQTKNTIMKTKANNFGKVDIERGIDFTREMYEEKRALSKMELVDYDDFISNVLEAAKENEGTLEDAIFMADDAFHKLS